MESLKLSDVLARARLRRWTTAYALKHPEHLPGMPTAGSQGIHRLFDPMQAFRLAVFTLALDSGYDLTRARHITMITENRLNQIENSLLYGDPNYRGDAKADRMLWIYDGDFITVDCANLVDDFENRWFNSVERLTNVKPPIAPMRKLEINLNALSRSINGEPGR